MLRRRKIVFISIGAALLAGVAAIPIALLVSARWHDIGMMERAIPIERQLEAFRQTHGEYPESLSVIGIIETEAGPWYYRRPAPSEYELSFAPAGTLGESRIYRSATHKWD